MQHLCLALAMLQIPTGTERDFIFLHAKGGSVAG